MTQLYLDTYSGISGDMFLGALLDLGADANALNEQLQSLDIGNWNLKIEKTTQSGISGTKIEVEYSEQHIHRNLQDIVQIITKSKLPDSVKNKAIDIFHLIAQSEAKVHGTSVDEIHFHEVGAVDSIIDVVGTCLALHLLEIDQIYCSSLPLGDGFVSTSHGKLPVPAPATLEILSTCDARVTFSRGSGEMVTPTGAALVAKLAHFDIPTAAKIRKIGYGFGSRHLPWPNALRAILLEKDEPSSALNTYDVDEVVMIETNIDDLSPELTSYMQSKLLRSGALDVWISPVIMKKGRYGHVISVLTLEENALEITDLLLRETTTLGVRESRLKRVKARREIREIDTKLGKIRLKLKLIDGKVHQVKPEYEDCVSLAQKHDMPIDQVYDLANVEARKIIGREIDNLCL